MENLYAVVTNISNFVGNSPTKWDIQYIKPAFGKVVKLVHKVPDEDTYITDFFMSEYMAENNDYIHYGFLKVCSGNIRRLDVTDVALI